MGVGKIKLYAWDSYENVSGYNDMAHDDYSEIALTDVTGLSAEEYDVVTISPYYLRDKSDIDSEIKNTAGGRINNKTTYKQIEIKTEHIRVPDNIADVRAIQSLIRRRHHGIYQVDYIDGGVWHDTAKIISGYADFQIDYSILGWVSFTITLHTRTSVIGFG